MLLICLLQYRCRFTKDLTKKRMMASSYIFMGGVYTPQDRLSSGGGISKGGRYNSYYLTIRARYVAF